MIKLLNRSALLSYAVVLVCLTPGWILAAPKNDENPDFTTGAPLPEDIQYDWNLGATGARGWMYAERLSTIKARHIYITKIHPGSPAEGVLEVGDIILGINNQAFSEDPRVELGRAVTEAEEPRNGGRLRLLRWRDGKTDVATLRLATLAEYSDTAPYRCPKSQRILTQGCEALAKRMQQPNYRVNPTERSLNALALLASGDAKYLPLIKREAQWAADFKTRSFETWWYGYAIMLLSEYIMETGDQSVMPGLERLALEAANGQSNVGSWGHGFALSSGRLGGYGMMNAPGLTLTTSLILAREAGVKSPAISQAIDRSVLLLRFYVGKGSIPYGDHAPWIQTHDDNGKNGIAAVMFNLLGDAEATEYFAKMSLASYGNERDQGHTGNFWNLLWALPGVSQGGPNATGAWMEAYGSWYFDLAREWDGTFGHQSPPGYKSRYQNWDCTGAYLLAYALPLQNLHLTGAGRSAIAPLSKAEAEQVVLDGKGWDNLDRNSYYDGLSTKQQLERLSSWSPVVRERAAIALSRSKVNVVPQLIDMLNSKDLHTRLGACQGLEKVRADRSAAVPWLIVTMQDSEDLWLRVQAAEALAGIGNPARVAIPDMLKQLANVDAQNDPRGLEQRYLCFALFESRDGLIGRSVEDVDRELLLEAVRVGLKNQDGRARSSITSVYSNLSFEELRPLMPSILEAVVEPAPSGIMFATGIRTNGLELLAKHHVKEGMDASFAIILNENTWGSPKRIDKAMQSLLHYGVHAQALIPRLEEAAKKYDNGELDRNRRQNEANAKIIREGIEKIKALTDRPELISIKEQNN